MHHLFYIENGLSLALVKAYIKEKDIPHESIILFLGRGQKAKVPYTTQDVSIWEFKTTINFFNGWRKTKETQQKITTYLSKQCISEYHFYTSSISKLSCYFLIHNTANKKTTFIEDGRAAYYSESEFRAYIKELHFSGLNYPLYQLKCWLNYRFKHYPNPSRTIPFLKKTNDVIVSSENSFSYINRKHIVKKLFYDETTSYNHIQCLMCLSYPVEDGLITLTEYIKVLNRTFDFLVESGINKVHYKFHPQQTSNPQNLKAYINVIHSFKNDLIFEELPSDTIMEVVAANSDAILLSDYSSTILYTHNFGNKIISNYCLIATFRTSNDKLPRLPKALTSIINKSNIPLRQ